MDEIVELIKKSGDKFYKLDKEMSQYCAHGIFKLNKKGTSQEVRFFCDSNPLVAIQMLYYELIRHHEELANILVVKTKKVTKKSVKVL